MEKLCKIQILCYNKSFILETLWPTKANIYYMTLYEDTSQPSVYVNIPSLVFALFNRELLKIFL